jgi:hypothetical protein
MQENTLKALISKRLLEISILKGIVLTEKHYEVWSNKILEDHKDGIVFDAQKGFKKLESEKSYGGLDYSVFLEGAKKNESNNAENAWNECLNSAKNGGRLQISARAAKALNSLGGMLWLRDSSQDQTNWQRKEFISIYNNTPNQENSDFLCPGLSGKIYLEESSNELPALQ